MKRVLFAAIAAIAMAGATAPAAAQSATLVGTYGDWGIYSYTRDGNKVCYVLTVAKPDQMMPKTLDHGKIYFSISQRPGQGVTYEPQFIASYNLADKSKVTATIGAKKFTMFTKEKYAWVENAAEEPALVAAMKSGAELKIDARSSRGNPTSYVFSLKGISAALDSVKGCK